MSDDTASSTDTSADPASQAGIEALRAEFADVIDPPKRPTAAQAVSMSQTGTAGGAPPVFLRIADLHRQLQTLMAGSYHLADLIGGSVPETHPDVNPPVSIAAHIEVMLVAASVANQNVARAIAALEGQA